MNIRFHYLYRDAANYKEFGSVIIDNPEGWSIVEVDLFLKNHLIQTEFFVPSNVGLPSLHANPYDPIVDHEWHQYEGLEWTDEEVDVVGFLKAVREKGMLETG